MGSPFAPTVPIAPSAPIAPVAPIVPSAAVIPSSVGIPNAPIAMSSPMPSIMPSKANGNSTKPNNFNSLGQILFGLEAEKVLESRGVRMATGAVSALLALYVIYRIWNDSWRASKLNAKPGTRKFAFLYRLHTAEIFPLFLGFFIFAQQLILISIQGSVVKSLFIKRCKSLAIFAFPALFFVGFLHLIFGLEMTIAAVRKSPFSNRWRFAPLLNITIVGLIILSTFIVAKTTSGKGGKCAGTIAFIVDGLHMNDTIVGIQSGFIISFLVMAAIIAVQLLRTIHIDPNERIAGSRMVYYLLLSVAQNVTVLPFFAKLSNRDLKNIFTTGTLAEYSIFASGAFLALAHLFLRTNASRTAIKPRETPWLRNRRFKFFGPSELEILNISPPLNLVNPSYTPDEKAFEANRAGYTQYQTFLNTTPSPSFTYPPKAYSPTEKSTYVLPPPPTFDAKFREDETPSPNLRKPGHKRQASYSLFPGAGGEDPPRLPATVYNPTATKALPASPTPPPPGAAVSVPSAVLAPPSVPWLHKRLSSSASRETVQIGLRLSNAPTSFFPSRRRSSVPTKPSVPAKDGAAPFDDNFSLAFREQVKDATGRDLNSFRWIDTSDDVESRPGSRGPRGATRRKSLSGLRPLSPGSPKGGGPLVGKEWL